MGEEACFQVLFKITWGFFPPKIAILPSRNLQPLPHPHHLSYN